MPSNRRRSSGPSPSNPSEDSLIIGPGSVIEVEPAMIRDYSDYSAFSNIAVDIETSRLVRAVDPAPAPTPQLSYSFNFRTTPRPNSRSNSQRYNKSLPFAYREFWQCEKEKWTSGNSRVNDDYSFKEMQESFHRTFVVAWDKLTPFSYTAVLQSGPHDFDVYYYRKLRFISLKKSRLLPSGPAINKIGGGIIYAERQQKELNEMQEQINQQHINQQADIYAQLSRQYVRRAAGQPVELAEPPQPQRGPRSSRGWRAIFSGSVPREEF